MLQQFIYHLLSEAIATVKNKLQLFVIFITLIFTKETYNSFISHSVRGNTDKFLYVPIRVCVSCLF